MNLIRLWWQCFQAMTMPRFDGGDAPDYGPVSSASVETAEIGAELGREQLAEARRQYDQNYGVIGKVVEAQVGAMNEQLRQGKESYEYSKTYRPLEQDMLGVASQWKDQLEAKYTKNAEIRDLQLENANWLKGMAGWHEAEQLDAIKTLTGGNSGIVAKYGADIDNDVNTAIADARAGQSKAMGMAMREAMRYGLSVPDTVKDLGTAGASQIASAANSTRNNSIANYRNLVAQGIGQRDQAFRTNMAATDAWQSKKESAVIGERDRNMQDDAVAWGRGMDMVGVGRGMAGLSQGSYGLATAAGNSAAQNQNSASNVIMQGLNSSANTTMQGRQMALQGLMTAANGSGGENAGVAGLIGSLAGAAAIAWSDRSLKRDIQRLGSTAGGLPIYAFRYLWSDEVHVGVMADEVASVPGAVMEIGGFSAVDYRCLH